MSGIVVTSSGMADAPFTFNPAQYDPSLTNFAGSLTLDYRTVERDAQGNIVATGGWSPFTFTLYTPAPQASVTNFHLDHDTGASSTDLVTSDPTVDGTVSGDFTNETVDVQFSHQGDGTVDGWITVEAAGTSFSYDPRQADPTLDSYAGPLNLAYRTVEHDLLGGTITSPWISYPITLELTASQATISGLALTDVTGAAGPPPVTSDTTVAGKVVGALAGDAPEVQFQYNNDGKIDDLTTAAADGTFQETLPGLGYGNVTVMARPVEWDAADGVFLYGAWATLAFDHEPAAPPAVATLALANITDTATDANGNPMTSDPSIKGTLAAAAVGELLDIEIDTNGDGVPDDRTQVGQVCQPDGSADGSADPSQAGKPDLQFSFTPPGVPDRACPNRPNPIALCPPAG